MNRQAVRKAFGRVLRVLRHGAGLSQEDLAERADLDRTYPSLLERGKRTPTLFVIIKVAKALEITAATLVTMTQRRMEVEDEEI